MYETSEDFKYIGFMERELFEDFLPQRLRSSGSVDPFDPDDPGHPLIRPYNRDDVAFLLDMGFRRYALFSWMTGGFLRCPVTEIPVKCAYDDEGTFDRPHLLWHRLYSMFMDYDGNDPIYTTPDWFSLLHLVSKVLPSRAKYSPFCSKETHVGSGPDGHDVVIEHDDETYDSILCSTARPFRYSAVGKYLSDIASENGISLEAMMPGPSEEDPYDHPPPLVELTRIPRAELVLPSFFDILHSDALRAPAPSDKTKTTTGRGDSASWGCTEDWTRPMVRTNDLRALYRQINYSDGSCSHFSQVGWRAKHEFTPGTSVERILLTSDPWNWSRPSSGAVYSASASVSAAGGASIRSYFWPGDIDVDFDRPGDSGAATWSADWYAQTLKTSEDAAATVSCELTEGGQNVDVSVDIPPGVVLSEEDIVRVVGLFEVSAYATHVGTLSFTGMYRSVAEEWGPPCTLTAKSGLFGLLDGDFSLVSTDNDENTECGTKPYPDKLQWVVRRTAYPISEDKYDPYRKETQKETRASFSKLKDVGFSVSGSKLRFSESVSDLVSEVRSLLMSKVPGFAADAVSTLSSCAESGSLVYPSAEAAIRAESPPLPHPSSTGAKAMPGFTAHSTGYGGEDRAIAEQINRDLVALPGGCDYTGGIFFSIGRPVGPAPTCKNPDTELVYDQSGVKERIARLCAGVGVEEGGGISIGRHSYIDARSSVAASYSVSVVLKDVFVYFSRTRMRCDDMNGLEVRFG